MDVISSQSSAASTAVSDPLFWSHVEPRGECLEWVGYRDRQGYGMLTRKSVGSSPVMAHRYAVMLTTGVMPAGIVMHTCDNPPCVNIDHLRVATQADNIRDRDAKGHHRPGRMPGMLHPSARLADSDVMEIRTQFFYGTGARVLADRFGVSVGHIYAIVRGRLWTHLPVYVPPKRLRAA